MKESLEQVKNQMLSPRKGTGNIVGGPSHVSQSYDTNQIKKIQQQQKPVVTDQLQNNNNGEE